MRRCQRRSKRPRGVQGSSSERAGDEDAEGDRQADAKAGDRTKRAFFIDSSGEDGQNEEESGYGFESHACPARKIPGQLRCAQGDGTPGLFGNDGPQQKCGGSRAGELRGPIEDGVHGVHALGDPEADGHGGIEMSAGDVAEGGNHDRNGESVGEGDAEKAEATNAMQILIGADGACAEENQGKRSQEFRDQLLRCAVHQ